MSSVTIQLDKLDNFVDELEKIADSYNLKIEYNKCSAIIDFFPLLGIGSFKKNSTNRKQLDVNFFKETLYKLNASSLSARIQTASRLCGVSEPTLRKIYKCNSPKIDVQSKVYDSIMMMANELESKNQRMVERVSKALKTTDKESIANKIISNESILKQTDFETFESIMEFLDDFDFSNTNNSDN